jgi:hypothetical protein
MKEEIYPFRYLRSHEIGMEESGVMNRKRMRLRATKRTCGSINYKFQQEIERSRFGSRG